MGKFDTKSIDSIGWSINGRPVGASMPGMGSFSSVGPRSEYIKAGTNVLSISVVEKATDAMRQAKPYVTEETASVELHFRRHAGGEMLENYMIVNEKFDTIPTNFVFTVPDNWPVKTFVWESGYSEFTNQDKIEIEKLYNEISEAYVSIFNTRSYENVWNLEKYKNEHHEILNGISMDALKEQREGAINLFLERYSNKKVEFENMEFHKIPGLNLVKISV